MISTTKESSWHTTEGKCSLIDSAIFFVTYSTTIGESFKDFTPKVDVSKWSFLPKDPRREVFLIVNISTCLRTTRSDTRINRSSAEKFAILYYIWFQRNYAALQLLSLLPPSRNPTGFMSFYKQSTNSSKIVVERRTTKLWRSRSSFSHGLVQHGNSACSSTSYPT